MRLICREGNVVYLAGSTLQSTVRIDRITRKALISRDFVRAVLSWGADRHDKYRPRIDGLEVSCFAGLSCR
jgi:hypothetical protein